MIILSRSSDMVVLSINLLTNKYTDSLMDSYSKRHKKTRSVSPLLLQAGSTQDIRNTPNLTSQNTLRSNQFTDHLEDKSNQRQTSANEPQKQRNTAFLKNKIPGKIYAKRQNPIIVNKPNNINITFTYDSITPQNKLKHFLEPFPSQKLSKNPEQNEKNIENKNENSSLNTAQKRALNQQMASTTPHFFNPHKQPYHKLSSERRKDTSKYKQKNKQFGKERKSINIYQLSKKQPKGKKNLIIKKNTQGQPKPKKTEKQLTKKSNTIQTQEKIEKSDSKIKQAKINKDFEGLQELLNNKILALESKNQLLIKKNQKLQKENVFLKKELKVYSQMKSQQPLKSKLQQSQEETISNQKESQAILKLISKNLENKESQLHVLTQKFQQLQAVIANWKVDQVRYSSAFKKEYVQLMDRLKERESVIQQLQTSNNILREQYAQLHINIQRITKEKEIYLHQELEQQSFTSQQNRLFIASSIR